MLLALASLSGCAERSLEPCKHSCSDWSYPPGPYRGGLFGTLPDLPLPLWQDRNRDGISDDGPVDGLLSDYRVRALAGGPRVLVIAGYAEWCGPCRTEQRDLNEAARANPDALFLTALLEGNAGTVPAADAATEWARMYGVPHDLTQATDARLDASLGVNTLTLPVHLVVSLCEVTVRAAWYGKDPMRLAREIEVGIDATRP